MWLLLIILLPIIYLWYNRWSWTIEFWEFKDLHGPKPLAFVGNLLPLILGKKSFGELCLEWSREFKDHPLVGIYALMKPCLMVRRLDYVETVLIKEFGHFTDRGPPSPIKGNISDYMLFNSTGNTWKVLRNKLVPLFTSGKLKGMVAQLKLCFENTNKKLEMKSEIDSLDFIPSYVIDLTAKIGFGIESDNLSDRNSEFWKRCHKLSHFTYIKFLKNLSYFYIPSLTKLLNISFFSNDEVMYFHKIIKDTMKHRRESGEKRNDVIQLLLELKEKGHLEIENWDEADNYLKLTEQNKSKESIDITDDLIISQALVFLTTGFDTISLSLTFTLLELAQNKPAMRKLVEEIDDVIGKHDGQFTYDALKDMKFMDMCLMESMRLHPVVEKMTRQCVRNYTFDNGHQIEKGYMLIIPILAIHMDPDNFSEPEKFIPERFLTPPKPASYLPFGDGPRICIAKRFSMLAMKMFLANLLYSYEVELSPKTRLPVKKHKRNFLTSILSPIYFKISKRSRT